MKTNQEVMQMGLKVKQYPDTWFFSKGILTEHTQAYYKITENTLVIVHRKHLPKILEYLRTHLSVRELKLLWF